MEAVKKEVKVVATQQLRSLAFTDNVAMHRLLIATPPAKPVISAQELQTVFSYRDIKWSYDQNPQYEQESTNIEPCHHH